MLFNVQLDCTTFDDLKIIQGKIYDTFCDACIALGLLANDTEFIDGIKETFTFASGHYLRRLFVTLILSNSMSNPSVFLEETWSLLIECILYDKMKELKLPSIHFNILSYYFIYYLNMYKLIISF